LVKPSSDGPPKPISTCAASKAIAKPMAANVTTSARDFASNSRVGLVTESEVRAAHGIDAGRLPLEAGALALDVRRMAWLS
jgi:hypothetical protein